MKGEVNYSVRAQKIMLLYPLGGWCPFFPWLARVKPRGTENIGMGLCNTVWDSAVRSALSPSNPEESHRESFSDVLACEDFVYPARGQKIMTSFSLGGLLFFFFFFLVRDFVELTVSKYLPLQNFMRRCWWDFLYKAMMQQGISHWVTTSALPFTVNRQHEQPEPAMLGQLGRVY